MKVIDISVPITKDTVVYPGNPPFETEVSVSESSKSRLTKLSFSSHFGTHIDAPNHADQSMGGIESYDLERFVGVCRVIDCGDCQGAVDRETLERAQIEQGDRILLKTTNSSRGLDTFYEDFVYVHPEAALYLAEVGVALVGIDYFSIKQRGSTDNRPHIALLAKGIPIIEGVNLRDVEAGQYELLALPLALDGIDGSPCRAVLRTL